jgi:hypothetical protein
MASFPEIDGVTMPEQLAERFELRDFKGTLHKPPASNIPSEAHADTSEEDLPIDRYDSLTGSEIIAQLSQLSAADLAKVDAYERSHANRKMVRNKVAALQR